MPGALGQHQALERLQAGLQPGEGPFAFLDAARRPNESAEARQRAKPPRQNPALECYGGEAVGTGRGDAARRGWRLVLARGQQPVIAATLGKARAKHAALFARLPDVQDLQCVWLRLLLLLHREPGQSRIERAELERRADAFHRGEWPSLLRAACSSTFTRPVPHAHADGVDLERRAAPVHLEELSAASRALTAEPLAAGNDATLAELLDPDRRPQTPVVPLSLSLRRYSTMSPQSHVTSQICSSWEPTRFLITLSLWARTRFVSIVVTRMLRVSRRGG